MGVKICSIHFFMKAFYASLNLVESIFSSKVIMLLNNCKNYEEVQRPLIYRCH